MQGMKSSIGSELAMDLLWRMARGPDDRQREMPTGPSPAAGVTTLTFTAPERPHI